MSIEKHEPVIKVKGETIIIEVGEIIHPMSDAHLIEWIEIEADGKTERKVLTPNDQPIVEFKIPAGTKTIIAREHCNLHGTWESKKEL